MIDLFGLFTVGTIYGLGIAAIVWLFGLFVSGCISVVFKNNNL